MVGSIESSSKNICNDIKFCNTNETNYKAAKICLGILCLLASYLVRCLPGCTGESIAHFYANKIHPAAPPVEASAPPEEEESDVPPGEPESPPPFGVSPPAYDFLEEPYNKLGINPNDSPAPEVAPPAYRSPYQRLVDHGFADPLPQPKDSLTLLREKNAATKERIQALKEEMGIVPHENEDCSLGLEDVFNPSIKNKLDEVLKIGLVAAGYIVFSQIQRAVGN